MAIIVFLDLEQIGMLTNSKWKWATSVCVVACLTVGQMELAAFSAPPDGVLSVAIAETHQPQSSVPSGREIVVDVRTGDIPAAGASVEFTLPDAGPGGFFANGGLHVTVKADAQGRARSGNFYTNNVPGPFLVAVQASQAGATAGATVPQINPAATQEPPKTGLKQKLKNWKVLAVIAGVGVGIAAFLVTRKPKPADVTVGVPTVGSPR